LLRKLTFGLSPSSVTMSAYPEMNSTRSSWQLDQVAVHAGTFISRHDDVGQQQAISSPRSAKISHASRRDVAGFQHVVALPPQHRADDHAHGILVLDEQDRVSRAVARARDGTAATVRRSSTRDRTENAS
jgi:hypothetical protein